MTEPVDWDAAGNPRSPRFGDMYRNRDDGQAGLAQARGVFLAGCGLPAGWQGRRSFQILETGFGLGLNFLTTWQAWRNDPQRCDRLLFTSVEAFPVSADDLRRGAAPFPELQPLADALAGPWWGLSAPGVHRLSFDGGRVLLTLVVNDAAAALRERLCEADAVFLDGFSPSANPGIWSADVMRGVARNCRPGAAIASYTIARTVLDALAQAGFSAERAPGLPPKRDRLVGRYNPVFQGKPGHSQRGHSHFSSFIDSTEGRRCVVVGAGLAGSSAALSLARRGWAVTVLDRAAEPAAGASGLPAGLAVPHASPDDNALSRLTRAGLRATTQRAQECLQEGSDWAVSGVLERRDAGKTRLPGRLDDGCAVAGPGHLAAARLPADTPAFWHPRAAWLKPAALVRAQLAAPGVTFVGQAAVASLRQQPNGGWALLDAAGAVLAQAPLVVLAGAADTAALLQPLGAALPLNPLRGQVAFGPGGWSGAPATPVNGDGALLPAVPSPDGPFWLAGSTFERDARDAATTDADHAANAERLARLLPALAPQVAERFATAGRWAGVRATLPDRLPAVGFIDAERWPGLAVLAGLGARGLSLAVLCGEVLAAEVAGEPLPVAPKLARMLRAGRCTAAQTALSA